MKPKFYTLLILSATLILFGCKSASKLYHKGDYDAAVEKAVKELQKKPGDAERKELVKKAYEFAVNDHEDRIRSYHESNNELKWEWIYHEYADLQNLYNAIKKSPVVFEIVFPVDYSSEMITYGEKAGDVHVERGLRWMQKGDKESAKMAYREFQSAMRFKQGDPEIQEMLAEAFDYAVTRVVILPGDQFGFIHSNYNYELQNFSDDVIRNMQYGNHNEFVQFFSAWDAGNRGITPDHVIEMQFNNLNIGRYQDRKSTREVIKDVVIKETVYKPDSVIKEYGKVKAKITTTTRTLYSDGFLGFVIRDNNRRILWSDNIGGSYSWTTEFSTYTGDERALGEEDKRLVDKIPQSLPHDSEIFRIIKNNIYNDLTYRLKNFYTRY